MTRSARVVTIPRRPMNSDELESFRSEVFRQVEKSARIRKLLVYLGMAALFLLGMVAQYALTHFL